MDSAGESVREKRASDGRKPRESELWTADALPRAHRIGVRATLLLAALAWAVSAAEQLPAASDPASDRLSLIRPSADGTHFVRAENGTRFTPWGFNYDHDDAGRLLEDYWAAEWPTVESDFQEMKALGANLVRIHLQLGRFMRTPREPDATALAQLERLVRLAEHSGLYLDLTGLGCYHKQDVPVWYDALDEAERWEVQAAFWAVVAKACAASPAVFCYDLMNEPVLPGAKKVETEWLAGNLGGKYFVQRITLDLAGRAREQVAKAWIEKLVAAIRRHDPRHMITVGAIPWNMSFPGARPLFHAPEVGGVLDFVSVHFYPQKGEVPKALAALAAYELGKPVLIEEIFPLKCSLEELGKFIDGSRRHADGWVGFYWGQTIADYAQGQPTIARAVTRAWLEFFQAKAPEITGASR
jgi:hypothetical protein